MASSSHNASLSSDTMQIFITLHLPADLSEDNVELLAENISDLALAVITDKPEDIGSWRVRWLVNTMPDLVKWAEILNYRASELEFKFSSPVLVSDFIAEDVPDIDWVAHNLEHFRPFEIGRFLIHGSHCSDEITIHQKKITLVINATTAFGTGQHPTTEGCLKALEYLHAIRVCDPSNILDMGTGTGILGIAAAKLWPGADILGVDNDPDSIDVAQDHIVMNQTSRFKAVTGEGFTATDMKNYPDFDLILANILARPLKEMANDLSNHLIDDGYTVLSGLLTTQAEDVKNVYESAGLKLYRSIDIAEWSTLIFVKSL